MVGSINIFKMSSFGIEESREAVRKAMASIICIEGNVSDVNPMLFRCYSDVVPMLLWKNVKT